MRAQALTTAFVATAVALSLAAAAAPPALGSDAVPSNDARFVERIVEFVWLEGSDLWTDTFRVRAYPRNPQVGTKARISQRIRRTRNGAGKTPPEPLRVECTIRREDGGGQSTYTANKPGHEVAFEHPVEKPGRYVASLVTWYSEEETYTIAIRFEAVRAQQ